MRLSGRASTMSAGVRSTRYQASGLCAAIVVMGAMSSPICARYSSSPTSSAARRALSKTANVSHAWKTSCATSIGSGGASQGYGERDGGANEAS